MNGIELIPHTAWEQAVFVVLFIVVVLGILSWASKQQGKWQDFIAQQNNAWQNFTKEERKETAVSMGGMQSSIVGMQKSIVNLEKTTGELVINVREMRSDIRCHGDKVDDVLEVVKNPKASRPKKTVKAEGNAD